MKNKRKGLMPIDSTVTVLENSRSIVRMEAEDDNVQHTIQDKNPKVLGVEGAKGKIPKKITVANWSNQNNWPQHVLEKLKENGIAKRGLKVHMESIYGKGLQLFTYDYSDHDRGFNFLNPSEASDVYAWLRKSRIKRYLKRAIRNYSYFEMQATQFILNNGMDKILSIHALDMDKARVSEANENGQSEWLVYSTTWAESTDKLLIEGENKNADILPILPKELIGDSEGAKEWVKNNNFTTFVIISEVDSLGREYYQDADWHTIVRSGIIDLPGKIHTFKKKMMENQMSLKYEVIVANEYWEIKYPDTWASMSGEQKEEKRQELLQSIDEALTGEDNAHKSIQIPAIVGNNGELVRWIQIKEFDMKNSGSGDLIPDLDTANNEILKAIGVNPALIGHGATGSKMGPGSGSDIREAHLVETNSNQFAHDTITEPLYFVRDYNGWADTIEFGFPNVTLTTLDRNKSGIEPTAP